MRLAIRAGAVAIIMILSFTTRGSPQVDRPIVALRGEIGVVPREGSTLARPAGLVARGVTVSEALDRLSRAADVRIAFSPNSLSGDREIDCFCQDVSIAQALDRILDGTGYGYSWSDSQIVIAKLAPRETLRSLQDSPAQAAAAAAVPQPKEPPPPTPAPEQLIIGKIGRAHV